MSKHQKVILGLLCVFVALYYFLSLQVSEKKLGVTFKNESFSSEGEGAGAKTPTFRSAPTTHSTPRAPSSSTNPSLPAPDGPGAISWKLDYQGNNFLSYLPYYEGIRIASHELRFERIGDSWKHIEGSYPQEPRNQPSAVVLPTDLSRHVILSDEQAPAELHLHEKIWWLNEDGSYQLVLNIEANFPGKKRETWFVDAEDGHILKKTARARH